MSVYKVVGEEAGFWTTGIHVDRRVFRGENSNLGNHILGNALGTTPRDRPIIQYTYGGTVKEGVVGIGQENPHYGT